MAGDPTNDPGLIRLEGASADPEAELRGFVASHAAGPERLGEAELMGESFREQGAKRRLSGYLAIVTTVSAILVTGIVGAHALSVPTSPHSSRSPLGSVGSSIRSAGSSVKAQSASAFSTPSASPLVNH